MSDQLPVAPLPNALTEYEKPDWDELMKSGSFSNKRAKIVALANHSKDAKMYAEGCIREIMESAAGASVLETVAHIETLLGPLQAELGHAVSLLKEERDNPETTPARFLRLLNQTLKAEKGVREIIGAGRELVRVNAGTYIEKQLNYADLRKGAGDDKPIPATLVDDFEENV